MKLLSIKTPPQPVNCLCGSMLYCGLHMSSRKWRFKTGTKFINLFTQVYAAITNFNSQITFLSLYLINWTDRAGWNPYLINWIESIGHARCRRRQCRTRCPAFATLPASVEQQVEPPVEVAPQVNEHRLAKYNCAC
jgi:hypothetical protein